MDPNPTSFIKLSQGAMLKVILRKMDLLEEKINSLEKKNQTMIAELNKLKKIVGLESSIEKRERIKPPEIIITFERPNDMDSQESSSSNIPGELVTDKHSFDSTTKQPKENSSSADMIPAEDMINRIETLNGQSETKVEDFIKSVEKAQIRCSQPDLLLDLILTEKITGIAKKAIQYAEINDFNELYSVLRINIPQIISISLLYHKLKGCKQEKTEPVQYFNKRFRGILDELIYLVVKDCTNSTERNLAIDVEEKKYLDRYLLNLRREIGSKVKTRKPRNLKEARKFAVEEEFWLEKQKSQKIQTKQVRNSTSLDFKVTDL